MRPRVMPSPAARATAKPPPSLHVSGLPPRISIAFNGFLRLRAAHPALRQCLASSTGISHATTTALESSTTTGVDPSPTIESEPLTVTVRVWYNSSTRQFQFIECGEEVIDFLIWVSRQPLASLVDVLTTTASMQCTSRDARTLNNMKAMCKSFEEIKEYTKEGDISFRASNTMILRFPKGNYSQGLKFIDKKAGEEIPKYSHSPEDSMMRSGVTYIVTDKLQILPLKNPEHSLHAAFMVFRSLGIDNFLGITSRTQEVDQVTPWKLIDGVLNTENPLTHS